MQDMTCSDSWIVVQYRKGQGDSKGGRVVARLECLNPELSEGEIAHDISLALTRSGIEQAGVSLHFRPDEFVTFTERWGHPHAEDRQDH